MSHKQFSINFLQDQCLFEVQKSGLTCLIVTYILFCLDLRSEVEIKVKNCDLNSKVLFYCRVRIFRTKSNDACALKRSAA